MVRQGFKNLMSYGAYVLVVHLPMDSVKGGDDPKEFQKSRYMDLCVAFRGWRFRRVDIV